MFTWGYSEYSQVPRGLQAAAARPLWLLVPRVCARASSLAAARWVTPCLPPPAHPLRVSSAAVPLPSAEWCGAGDTEHDAMRCEGQPHTRTLGGSFGGLRIRIGGASIKAHSVVHVARCMLHVAWCLLYGQMQVRSIPTRMRRARQRSNTTWCPGCLRTLAPVASFARRAAPRGL